jgi:hypothetical protein
LFGKLKIEILDAKGNVVDQLPGSTRRGLNRVVWTMHIKPPHVPPAVQLAQAGTQGPRALPGTYTVRLEKNGKTYETQLTVGLDRRVKWSLADRQAQFDAAMKVAELFNDESVLFEQIAALREQVAETNKNRSAADPLHRKLADFDGKLDGLRKQIVATTEGGAITGEERLREHTDQLYAAIIGWDGPPSTYALDNIVALRSQLNDVSGQFTHITSAELPGINKALEGKGGHALSVPAPTAFEDDDQEGGAGGVRAAGQNEPDARMGIELPKNLRLWN